jgi:hypothetical protein
MESKMKKSDKSTTPVRKEAEELVKRAEQLDVKLEYDAKFDCFGMHYFGDYHYRSIGEVVSRLNEIEKFSRMSVAKLRELEDMHRYGITERADEISSVGQDFQSFEPPRSVNDSEDYKNLMEQSVDLCGFPCNPINDLVIDLESWHDVMAALVSKLKQQGAGARSSRRKAEAA